MKDNVIHKSMQNKHYHLRKIVLHVQTFTDVLLKKILF